MDCSACLSCGMVVLLVMTGLKELFHRLWCLGRRACFEYMCAGIGHFVVAVFTSDGTCRVAQWKMLASLL